MAWVLAARQWWVATMLARRIRLTGLHLTDSASGLGTLAAAAVEFHEELDIAATTDQQLCVALFRVVDGDPVEAGARIRSLMRRHERAYRVEFDQIACVFIVDDRPQAVLAASRICQSLSTHMTEGAPYSVTEVGMASCPVDGVTLLDACASAATRFAPLVRFEAVAAALSPVDTAAATSG